MTRLVILYLLVICSISIEAQLVCRHYYFENNSTTVPDSIRSLRSKAIMFFCPMYGMSTSDSVMYMAKSNDLYRNIDLSNLSEVYLYFFFFKEDPKNNSNGIQIKSFTESDAFPISQQTCLFVNFNDALIRRAQNRTPTAFDVKQIFEGESIYKISIVDGKQCFRSIQDRIPFYSDFIKEVIKPTYSIEERFQQVYDTLGKVQVNVSDLEIRNLNLRKEVDSLKIILDQSLLRFKKK